MRIIRHVRTWCQPGQPGPLRLGLLVSLLLLGVHTTVIAQHALLGTTQRAIGTLVVIRSDKIEGDVSNLWICYPLGVRENHQRE